MKKVSSITILFQASGWPHDLKVMLCKLRALPKNQFQIWTEHNINAAILISNLGLMGLRTNPDHVRSHLASNSFCIIPPTALIT